MSHKLCLPVEYQVMLSGVTDSNVTEGVCVVLCSVVSDQCLSFIPPPPRELFRLEFK